MKLYSGYVTSESEFISLYQAIDMLPFKPYNISLSLFHNL